MKTAEATTSTSHQNTPQSKGNSPQSDFDDTDYQTPVTELLQQRNENGQFTNGNELDLQDRGRTQLREARQLQRFIFRDASDPKIKPSDLALLSRAWCALQESIRVLRGIPLPGQFRPDSLPMKRGKRGSLIELSKAGGASFAEATEATTAPDAGKRTTPTATKRATTADDATTGETGPG